MTENGERDGRRRGISHDTPPQLGEVPPKVLEAALIAMGTEYSAKVRALGDTLRGKVVSGTTGGHSGYLLRFIDGSWVAVWLDSERMDFATGSGEPPGEIVAQLSDPAVPDASEPLDIDRPYANERNDIGAEAARTEGKAIAGVAVGERAFSLRFPEGKELEGTVFQNAAGSYCLRVFWEQW